MRRPECVSGVQRPVPGSTLAAMTATSTEGDRADGFRYAMLGPGLASLVVLLLVGPTRMLTPAVPTGVDLGGHLYAISYWVEHWLSEGRVLGWSPGWFGGFPLYYFYFPLPAGMVAGLSVALPLTVALKVVAGLSAVAFPWAVWFLARSGGLSARFSAVTTLVGSSVLLMESHWHLGGNLYSTLLGEFSYAWSLLFCVVYVGILTRTLRDGTPRPVSAALTLAAAALSHVIPTFGAVVAGGATLFVRRARRTVLASWALGFCLAGFWAFPFLARSGYLAHTEWNLELATNAVFPLEVLFVLPLAVGGVVRLAPKGTTWVALLAFTALSPVISWLPGLPMGDRLLPLWFVGVHVLAGVFVASSLERTLRDRSPGGVAGLAVGVLLIGSLIVLRGPGTVRDYAIEVMEGYPAAPAADEFQQLLADVRLLPPGRVHWQSDSTAVRFGRSFALDLLPYWDPDHPTLPGLLRESSLTEPYVAMVFRETSPEPYLRFRVLDDRYPFDFARGVAHMRMLGVRYFIAFTEAVRGAADRHPGLERRVDRNGYAIFELDGVQPVEVASEAPRTVRGGELAAAARAWFEEADALDRWIVAGDADLDLGGGEGGGARVGRVPAPTSEPGRADDPVTDFADGPREVRFTTSAVGVPHLVRLSYFPNWEAEGAVGPYHAAPNLMLVVPTSEEVRLRFRSTWVEWTGGLLTLLGLALLAVPAGRGWLAGGRARDGRPPARSAVGDLPS